MTLSDLRFAVLRRARQPGRLGALAAGAALRLLPRGRGSWHVTLWGRSLALDAGHHLPFIVHSNPLWGTPLVSCAATLPAPRPHIVDVGANIGDSVALIEHHLPGRCTFTCIEPHPQWRRYCEQNTSGLPVEILDCIVGDGNPAVLSGGGGTAGSRSAPSGQRTVPLDTLFATRHVDLLKIDTDGFDAVVLRSGPGLLARHKPALFFEWDPRLWLEAGEDPAAVFPFLAALGYTDFCLFTDGGFFYLRMHGFDAALIRSLIQAAQMRQHIDALHWDVFAAPPELCDAAVARQITLVQEAAPRLAPWNRLQPAFWMP